MARLLGEIRCGKTYNAGSSVIEELKLAYQSVKSSNNEFSSLLQRVKFDTLIFHDPLINTRSLIKLMLCDLTFNIQVPMTIYAPTQGCPLLLFYVESSNGIDGISAGVPKLIVNPTTDRSL